MKIDAMAPTPKGRGTYRKRGGMSDNVCAVLVVVVGGAVLLITSGYLLHFGWSLFG
jgi:hypothetical protein